MFGGCARRISLEDVSREIAALSQGLDGHLRIGSGPGVAPELLPRACTRVLEEGSKATFKITVLTNDILVPALRRGELDLIVSGIPSVAHADLVQEPLYADEFAVVARAGHRLARRSNVTIEDIASEQWVLSAANVVSWHALHRIFEDHRLPPPRVILESNSTSIRLQTVSRSDLLGFGSRRFMQQAAQRLGLAEIRVDGLAWSRRVGVSYRGSGHLSGLARRFMEALKTCAGSIDEK